MIPPRANGATTFEERFDAIAASLLSANDKGVMYAVLGFVRGDARPRLTAAVGTVAQRASRTRQGVQKTYGRLREAGILVPVAEQTFGAPTVYDVVFAALPCPAADPANDVGTPRKRGSHKQRVLEREDGSLKTEGSSVDLPEGERRLAEVGFDPLYAPIAARSWPIEDLRVVVARVKGRMSRGQAGSPGGLCLYLLRQRNPSAARLYDDELQRRKTGRSPTNPLADSPTSSSGILPPPRSSSGSGPSASLTSRRSSPPHGPTCTCEECFARLALGARRGQR